MQTNPLTKTESALLYGYGYRLVDTQNRIWLVQGALKNSLSIIQVSPREGYTPELIDASRIGADYHVLVHPISRLTTEIEGIGVAIDVLNKRAMNISNYKVANLDAGTYLLATYRPEINVLHNWEAELVMAWHFDTMNFLERGIGKII